MKMPSKQFTEEDCSGPKQKNSKAPRGTVYLLTDPFIQFATFVSRCYHEAHHEFFFENSFIVNYFVLCNQNKVPWETVYILKI